MGFTLSQAVNPIWYSRKSATVVSVVLMEEFDIAQKLPVVPRKSLKRVSEYKRLSFF